jgi:hypothetical protein
MIRLNLELPQYRRLEKQLPDICPDVKFYLESSDETLVKIGLSDVAPCVVAFELDDDGFEKMLDDIVWIEICAFNTEDGKDPPEDDEYYQKYGKTEDELAEYLMQKEEDWGIEVDYWETDNGWWHFKKPYTGYVDEDILSGFLGKEGITIEEYLINKKYVVIQDGDEYGYYGDMKKAGLINMDAIDHEYPAED